MQRNARSIASARINVRSRRKRPRGISGAVLAGPLRCGGPTTKVSQRKQRQASPTGVSTVRRSRSSGSSGANVACPRSPHERSAKVHHESTLQATWSESSDLATAFGLYGDQNDGPLPTPGHREHSAGAGRRPRTIWHASARSSTTTSSIPSSISGPSRRAPTSYAPCGRSGTSGSRGWWPSSTTASWVWPTRDRGMSALPIGGPSNPPSTSTRLRIVGESATRFTPSCLIACRRQRFHSAVAVIALPNDPSVRLHERHGFARAGQASAGRFQTRGLARRRLVAVPTGKRLVHAELRCEIQRHHLTHRSSCIHFPGVAAAYGTAL